MTLPASGPISTTQIYTEFNGGVSIGLLSLYRGGGIVPNTSLNALIPTSGPIKLEDFYSSSDSVGKLTATGAGAITGIASDGTNIVATGNSIPVYHSTNGGVSYSTNANASNHTSHDVCFGSGTSWSLADTTESGGLYCPLFSSTPFSAGNVWTVGTTIANDGINGKFSIASNPGGTIFVSANGNVYSHATGVGTGWTVGVAANSTVTGAPGTKGTIKWVNGQFIAVSPNSNPFWSFGPGASWTQGPFPITPSNVQSVYDVAFGSAKYVMVGRTTAGPLIMHNTSLTSNVWTLSTVPAGFTTILSIIWIPSVSKFVIADSTGHFAKSTDGITWVAFRGTPIGAGSPAINCCCLFGTTRTLWGTSLGGVINILNTDLP